MLKKILFTIFTVFTSISVFSQTEKAIIVEHFTNTRCSVCASKNPGFYQNLAGHPDILHIAIHPSSPYSNCLLHLHNPTENDGRTNYYGVYGGTPRLVIQGVPQSFSINFSSPTIFDPFEGQTTPFSLRIKEYRIGTDSVRAELILKAVSSHGISDAKLFLAYVEDTIFYVSPNGETQHYDVFRKAFTAFDGNTINLPVSGDSVMMNYTMAVNTEWNPDRMKVIGILQDSGTKEMLQAGVTSSVEYLSYTNTNIFRSTNPGLKVFPNPANNVITIEKASGPVEIISMDGRINERIETDQVDGNYHMDISIFPEGTYLIRNEKRSALISISR